MLTMLLHFCLPFLATANASSPPGGKVGDITVSVLGFRYYSLSENRFPALDETLMIT